MVFFCVITCLGKERLAFLDKLWVRRLGEQKVVKRPSSCNIFFGESSRRLRSSTVKLIGNKFWKTGKEKVKKRCRARQ